MIFKTLSFALSDDPSPQEVVAAVAGKELWVVFLDLEIAEGATAALYSAAVAISHVVGKSRVWPPFMVEGVGGLRQGWWCKTVRGEALNMLVDGGDVKGLVGYLEV
jgi:hypothetical protein